MPATRDKPLPAQVMLESEGRTPDGYVTSMRVQQREQGDLPKPLIDKMRAQAQDPSVFDEGKLPYVFDLVSSTNQLDSHGTRMQPSTLKNYVADASAGVALLYGHNK